MDQMTTREHLEFYARIRGVPDIGHNVEAVIRAVGLQAFTTRMASKLSGGNKRKLSLGIALIGNPTVVLLDEPSSGMDAAAKRVMWKTLAVIVPGRSILLTTHSMEEADALADRAGIMARRMLATGTCNDLRVAHGSAHYVHLVMKSAPHTSEDEIEKVKSWILTKFPQAKIEDKTYHGQLRFSVPMSEHNKPGQEVPLDDANTNSIGEGGEPLLAPQGDGIGSIITLLDDHQEELGLEHYSVSPTTLDQVFLSIVQQNNVEEEGYSPNKKRNWIKTLMGRDK